MVKSFSDVQKLAQDNGAKILDLKFMDFILYFLLSQAFQIYDNSEYCIASPYGGSVIK